VFHSKKLLIIVALALVALGGGTMMLVRARLAGQPKAAEAKPAEPPHNLVLDDFTVNLADMSEPRYLKTTVAITFAADTEVEEAKQAEPQIRDAVIMTLTRQYFRDLLTWQGKRRLRADLKKAINGTLGPLGLQAEDVVFTAFVME
jgi:flagellar FliL protein